MKFLITRYFIISFAYNFILTSEMMLKPYIYCFVILEQMLNAQIIKNPRILKESIYKGAPKLWFAYIKAFMLKNVEIITTNHTYYATTILRDTTRRSAFLQKISYRIIQAPYRIIPHTTDISSTVVKVPIWNRLEYDENIQLELGRKWIFKLDRKLKANVTFEYIHIYINYLYLCKIGTVRVESFEYSEEWTHTYCGFQSTLICFPPHRNVEIYFSFEKYVSYEIIMRYSVIDTKLMTSTKQKRTEYLHDHHRWLQNPQRILQWRINMLMQKVQFLRFRFHYEKHKYLRITFPPTKYLVEAFDGPDTLSPMLQSKHLNDKLYGIQTSTFQCILNVCVGCTNFFKYQNKLKIKSFHVKQFKHKILNNQNISGLTYYYNTMKKNQNVDIIKLLFPDYVKINITIQNLSHNYNKNILCSYAGFVVYDRMETEENNHISTKCTPHTDIFRHQNIYSNSSTILLLAYSYKEYGSMNLSVRLSTTKCNIVRVNCESWDLFQNIEYCTVFQFTNRLQSYESFKLYYEKLYLFTSATVNLPLWCFSNLLHFIESFDILVLEIFTTGYLKGKIHVFTFHDNISN